MKRVKRLLEDAKFLEYLIKIEDREAKREFCSHDLQHLMDVARISYILWLEQGCPQDNFLNKEIIYITALLHDIGRWQEYDYGYDHAIISSKLAVHFLDKLKFTAHEIDEIVRAIAVHRKGEGAETLLAKFLYKADKLARPCYKCEAIDKCYKYEVLSKQPLY